jgi:hypothetical protein
MDDSIEADLLAARLLPFNRDEAAWLDDYITARSRLAGDETPQRATEAARAAWRSYGWAHPAAVAYLEHAHGPLDR